MESNSNIKTTENNPKGWLEFLRRCLPWLAASLLASTTFSIAMANSLLALLIVVFSLYHIASGGRKLHYDPLLLPASAVLVVRLLSLVLSPVAPALEGSTNKILFIISLFIISQISFTEKELSWTFWILLGVAVIVNFIAIPRGVIALFNGQQARITSTSGGYYTLAMIETMLGAAALAAAFYAKSTRWRIVLFICLAIYMMGLLFTWSRGPWFAMFCAFVLVALVYRRQVLWVAIFFVIAAALAIYTGGNLGTGGRFDPLSPDFDSQRFQYWRIGVNHFLTSASFPTEWAGVPEAIRSWAFGRGPDATIATMNGYQSDYITVLVESGILGVLTHLWLAVGAIIISLRRFLKTESRISRVISLAAFGCAVTWTVGGFFGDLIKDPQYYLLLMGLLGLSIAAHNFEKSVKIIGSGGNSNGKSM